MSKTILLNGAFGRMGQRISQRLACHPDFLLIAKIGKHDSLEQAIENHAPDIVIDFTTADCVWENLQKIIKYPVFPIIGTSGLNKEQIEQVIEQSKQKKQGGLIVPNFSLGAVLQMRCAEIIARYFPKIEIIEAHHEKKIDKPSGTALATAAKIQNTCNIPIHSIRLPGLVAKQEVIFGAEAETLSLVHNVVDRGAYLPGIILACQKVTLLNHIHYGLDICLDLYK